jgi:hypothetical protein
MYLPFCQEADFLAPEAAEMIQDYAPEQEVIFAMVDSADKAACVTLTAREIGSTPRQLYEEAVKGQQHIPIVPGAGGHRDRF